ncbi:hypothetical protein HCH_00627 [Hahella chejuensis KCTC 2396]|uniref:Uncharacterized protein n=1 Tax=Hahella chejuensis (strain KCTC 2396) TaxID=349521 RepID=Q2SP95_HAHCH|nr:hypothetical protein HCH_00627 [Hahella chejuensis KCTC 2396]
MIICNAHGTFGSPPGLIVQFNISRGKNNAERANHAFSMGNQGSGDVAASVFAGHPDLFGENLFYVRNDQDKELEHHIGVVRV